MTKAPATKSARVNDATPGARLLHILSQRPGRTGSGVTLAALIRAGAESQTPSFEQFVVVGVPQSEADALTRGSLELEGLAPNVIFPLAFESDALPFPVCGMSDSMPYPSTVFGAMGASDLDRYRSAWRAHLTRVIDKTRPDVIHVHHIWMVSALVYDVIEEMAANANANEAASRAFIRPQVVVHSHATGLRQIQNHPELGASVVERVRLHPTFLALHDDHKEALAKALDISLDRIVVVGAGFDPKVFNRAPTGGASTSDTPNRGTNSNTAAGVEAKAAGVVVYAGKISNAKGLPWLLDALDARRERGENTRLVVCGGGNDADAQVLIERMQAMPNVEHRGAVRHDELARTLRSATAFVLPSLYEGLPLVVAEALACGCRLAVTTLPGVTAAFAPAFGDALVPISLPPRTGVDGVAREHAAAFVDAIDGALTTALHRGPVANGAELAAPFSWNGVANRVVPLWTAANATAAKRVTAAEKRERVRP